MERLRELGPFVSMQRLGPIRRCPADMGESDLQDGEPRHLVPNVRLEGMECRPNRYSQSSSH